MVPSPHGGICDHFCKMQTYGVSMIFSVRKMGKLDLNIKIYYDERDKDEQ